MDPSSLRSLLLHSCDFARTLRPPPRFSCEEVRLHLQPGSSSDDPRTSAVEAAAAEVGAWMRLLPEDASREDRLGRAAGRLPSVVFWYREGLSAEDIGRRLVPFGERCYGDRAIDAACGLIAALINSGHDRRGYRTTR